MIIILWGMINQINVTFLYSIYGLASFIVYQLHPCILGRFSTYTVCSVNDTPSNGISYKSY